MMFTTRFDVAFTATLNKMVHPGGLLALLAVADATLSFLVPAVITAILSVSSSF
ncbi:hypothetical protein [Salmonella enterica]|uniref:hypothetical protein n=1 Tax=Salmonella enterica TaxID=28901 RepID=UPI0003A9E2CB|nr:hypothetical protein [Salmonella enterica]